MESRVWAVVLLAFFAPESGRTQSILQTLLAGSANGTPEMAAALEHPDCGDHRQERQHVRGAQRRLTRWFASIQRARYGSLPATASNGYTGDGGPALSATFMAPVISGRGFGRQSVYCRSSSELRPAHRAQRRHQHVRRHRSQRIYRRWRPRQPGNPGQSFGGSGRCQRRCPDRRHLEQRSPHRYAERTDRHLRRDRSTGIRRHHRAGADRILSIIPRAWPRTAPATFI